MELMNIENYSEYKAELDGAMHQAADAFVRIGYLLRLAQDTNILAESQYSNIQEMAKAEYGLSPDQVSRYISINERFSEGGYAPRLRDGMQGYGISKLQIMLTMSDEVVEVIPPEITKSELTAVQKDIKEEQQITDMEVLMEPKAIEGTPLEQFIKQYFHDSKDKYAQLYDACKEQESIDALLDAVAPSGIAMLRARVPGTGLLMLSIKGKELPATLVNARTNESTEYSLQAILETFTEIFLDINTPAGYMWMEVFSEEWEEKKEIAPVQKENPTEPKSNEQAAEQKEQETTEVAPDADAGQCCEVESTKQQNELAESEKLEAEEIPPALVTTKREADSKEDEKERELEQAKDVSEPVSIDIDQEEALEMVENIKNLIMQKEWSRAHEIAEELVACAWRVYLEGRWCK